MVTIVATNKKNIVVYILIFVWRYVAVLTAIWELI